MLDKIVTYNSTEANNEAGQDAKSKQWYCKSLMFKNPEDLEAQIIEVNKVLNKMNLTEKLKYKSEKKKLKDEVKK